MLDFTQPVPTPTQLLWKCDTCGWSGTVSQMVPETYTCPVCGEFNGVHVVMNLIKNHPMGWFNPTLT